MDLPLYLHIADKPQCFYCFNDAEFAVNIRDKEGSAPKGLIYCCEFHRNNLENDKNDFYISGKEHSNFFALTDIPGKTTILNIPIRS